MKECSEAHIFERKELEEQDYDDWSVGIYGTKTHALLHQ